MKKYFKYLSVFLLLAILCLTLASCDTNYYKYTEWEAAEDDSYITNGEKTYYRYDGEVDKVFNIRENFVYYYEKTVKLPDEGKKYYICRSVKSDEIIYLHSRSWDVTEYKVYATEYGASFLDDAMAGGIEALVMLDDKRGTECEITDSEIAKMLEMGKNEIPMKASDLDSYDRLMIYATGAEGFITRPYAAIYQDWNTQFYVDLTANYSIIDKYGNFLDSNATVNTIQMNSEQKDYISLIRSQMSDTEWLDDYEMPVYDEEAAIADKERSERQSKIILLVVVAIFGVLAPMSLVGISLYLAFKSRFAIKVTDYVLLVANSLWAISGIVIFIILLC